MTLWLVQRITRFTSQFQLRFKTGGAASVLPSVEDMPMLHPLVQPLIYRTNHHFDQGSQHKSTSVYPLYRNFTNVYHQHCSTWQSLVSKYSIHQPHTHIYTYIHICIYRCICVCGSKNIFDIKKCSNFLELNLLFPPWPFVSSGPGPRCSEPIKSGLAPRIMIRVIVYWWHNGDFMVV